MSGEEDSIWQILAFSFDITRSNNIFSLYAGALFLLAYILAMVVASLHVRHDPVVYPLTRPEPDMFFCEYIIKVKTSLKFGASLDSRGRVIIQLLGSYGDSVPLHLKKGKGIEFFLERGATNIFVYHSPYILGDIKEIKITVVNDAPHEIPYLSWRPSYISVIQSSSREFWGCFISKPLSTFDVYSEKLECKHRLKDYNGLLKSLCIFHSWISIFNSPVRFGMYDNFVNSMMVFFGMAAIMTTMLLFELAFYLRKLSDANEELAESQLVRCITVAFSYWVLEIILESFLRNTVLRVSASKYAKFSGLVPPVESLSGLRDFQIGYDWDQVRPLITEKQVVLPFGKRHKGAHCIFPVSQPSSFYNLWGLFLSRDERIDSWYLRTINFCALPLPSMMKWLSIEATGRKESLLVRQFMENFTTPVCFFHSWLLDWPLHYYSEPQQAGLIISHVIFKDLLAIAKMRNKQQQARLAQLSVHQWHGMICYIFLFIIKQSLEMRQEATGGIRAYIHQTITRFGKRSVREVQATWRKRQQLLKDLEYRRVMNPDEELRTAFSGTTDENVSAKQYAGEPQNISSRFRLNVKSTSEISQQSSDYAELYDSPTSINNKYLEDHLIFEEVTALTDPMNPLPIPHPPFISNRGGKICLSPKRYLLQDSSIYSIVEEGIVEPRNQDSIGEPAMRNRQKYLSSKGISLTEVEMGKARHDTIQIDINTISQLNVSVSARDTSSCDPEVRAQHNNSHEDETARSLYDSDGEDMQPNKNMNAADDADVLQPEMGPSDQKQSLMVLGHLKGTSGSSSRSLLHSKSVAFSEGRKISETEKISMPLSEYESTSLGPPFYAEMIRDVDSENCHQYLRCYNELEGYCCGDSHCIENLEIHKKVGHSSLEILRKILLDLLYFAMDNQKIKERSKLWLRKKMILDIFDLMEKKAERYSDGLFQSSHDSKHQGFNCNILLTSILTIVQVLVEITVLNQERSRARDAWERTKKYGIALRPVLRCLFCARKLEKGKKQLDAGCDKMEKLVTFFSRETINVAETELTVEFQHKLSLQKYCALIMNLARREILVELEDPPSVLTTKVTRAMIHKLLDEMLPKHTDFKDMSADELRRLGTRRQRIQARHDPKALANKKESAATKQKKQIISYILEDLGNKWKLSVRENQLDYCGQLLAQILVHERIMGFSVYSGFISREHQNLLDSSREHLREVEKKAYDAVLKIARNILLPKLKRILKSSRDVDVVFRTIRVETLYLLEAVSVVQVQEEPVFLKTCCYYIRDIVIKKVEEFKEFIIYMKKMDPAVDLKSAPKLKKMKTRYEIDGKIIPQTVPNLSAVCTPILRWGPVAIKGVPPLPSSLKSTDLATAEAFNDLMAEAMKGGEGSEQLQQVITSFGKSRRKMKSFLDVQGLDRLKKLQIHLARVQSRLTEQIALVSQSISDQYMLETDYQREYHRDELFDVELFATGKLDVPIAKAFGIILTTMLIILTLIAVLVTTLKASFMEVNEVTHWFQASVIAMAIYLMILGPLKCCLYCLFGFFVD